MPATIEALGIDRLSVPERLDLIEQIWSSLPDMMTLADVPDWHVEEVSRRRAAASAQPGVGRPWRDVLNELGTKS